MRILVCSDSHRRPGNIRRALQAVPQARDVFFLGDDCADLKEILPDYPDRVFHCVAGNCDFFPTAPLFDEVKIGSERIFYTHGHCFGVKEGTGRLLAEAKKRGCRIALFGHTHIPLLSYEDGVYLVNPGSLSRPRNSEKTFAVLDFLSGSILPSIHPL